MLKKLTTGLALLFLAALPAFSLPHGGPPPGFGDLVDPVALAHYLELTEDQIAAARDLHDAAREAAAPILEENRDLEGQLKELLEGDAPDATAIGEIVIAIHANRDALRAIQQELDQDFVALLTPDQQARYETLKEVIEVVRWSLAHDAPPGPPPGGDAPPAGGGPPSGD